MSDKKRKLLIDTDAGVDDAQAILIALMNPDVEVVGITCVIGNAEAHQVGLNVLRILKVVDRLDIPVYIGCNDPLLGDRKPCNDYHGKDGFGDVPDDHAPDASYINNEHAVSALSRISKENEGEVSLVCIGPLTNIAMAIRMDSQIGSRLKHCYIMGGNHYGKGNMTTSAEFNFYSDPEAAYVVLNQLGSPITMVTWETCESHSLSWESYRRLQLSTTAIGQFLAKIEKNVIATFYQPFFDKCVPKNYEIVDQYAVAAAMFDDVIVEQKSVYACVELSSPLTRGQLVVDWSNMFKRTPNEFYNQAREQDLPVINFLRNIESHSAQFSEDSDWGGFVPADEVLLACILHCDVIKSSCDVYATVDTKGQFTWGQMVIDWNSFLKKQKNVTVITDIHQNKFEDILKNFAHIRT